MRIAIASLAIALAACGPQEQIMTRYHEDGRAKPVVTVASMIDTTSAELPWSLSDEFTESVTRQLQQSGRLFLASNEEFSLSENPFGQDLSWAKREFPNQEFVVFLELVEHALRPADGAAQALSPQEISNNLEMAIRLRVVDLRPETPKIVLQEIVKESYFIPKTLLPTDYNLLSWGREGYEKTPMGVAHAAITSEIAHRVSDYLLLAKSR